MPRDPKAKKVIALWKQFEEKRENWNNLWQDVADVTFPTRQFITEREAGTENRSLIFDNTASNMAQRLGSAFFTFQVNPAIRWFELRAVGQQGPADVSVRDEERAWMYQATTIILSIFGSSRSGFAKAAASSYLDRVLWGTGPVEVIERPRQIRFKSINLNMLWIGRNVMDEVNKTFKLIDMLAEEVAARWGPFASEKTQRMAADPVKSQECVKILHAIIERMPGTFDPSLITQENKRFASIFIEVEEQHVLREGGMDEMPYIVPTWARDPDEVYGRSPSIMMLDAIRGIQAIKKDQLVASALRVRPPVEVVANSTEGPIRTGPGGITYRRQGRGNEPVVTPMLTGADPAAAQAIIAEDRDQIRQAFLDDILRIPENDRMTATEIVARQNRAMLQVAEPASMDQEEFLDPIVSRTLNWAMRVGVVTPLPFSLAARGVTVQYSSPLATSQRSSELDAFNTAMITSAAILDRDPGAFNRTYDSDETLRGIAAAANVNPTYTRTRAAARQIAEQEAQAAQDAQTAQTAAEGATAVRDAGAGLKSLSEARTA